MPNNDRSGPNGFGPRTGKQNGLCGKGRKKNQSSKDADEKSKGHGHRCGHSGEKKYPEGFKIYLLNP
jgi:hypothetical protein